MAHNVRSITREASAAQAASFKRAYRQLAMCPTGTPGPKNSSAWCTRCTRKRLKLRGKVLEQLRGLWNILGTKPSVYGAIFSNFQAERQSNHQDLWSGRWESNPRPKLGKLLHCHCTTPALPSKYETFLPLTQPPQDWPWVTISHFGSQNYILLPFSLQFWESAARNCSSGISPV